MSDAPPPPASPEPSDLEWLRAIVSDESQVDTDPLVEATREKVCWPHALLFKGEDRTIACKKCGKPFTHWGALMLLARHWGAYAENLRGLKGDVQRLTERREMLRSHVQRLRGMEGRAEVRHAPLAAAQSALRALTEIDVEQRHIAIVPLDEIDTSRVDGDLFEIVRQAHDAEDKKRRARGIRRRG